jgi:hypothetical protein
MAYKLVFASQNRNQSEAIEHIQHQFTADTNPIFRLCRRSRPQGPGFSIPLTQGASIEISGLKRDIRWQIQDRYAKETLPEIPPGA